LCLMDGNILAELSNLKENISDFLQNKA